MVNECPLRTKGESMESIHYRKILVTHDGSDLASLALPHAVALAHHYGAEILLLHVITSIEQETAMMSSLDGDRYPFVGIQDSAQEAVKENKREAKHQLEKIKTELEKNDVKVTLFVEEGAASSVIVDVARKEHCDLIVMATHGRSGLGRVLLGSVADHIIHHSPCPVMVIPPEERKQQQKGKRSWYE